MSTNKEILSIIRKSGMKVKKIKPPKHKDELLEFKMWAGYFRCIVRQKPEKLQDFFNEILENIPEEWEPNLKIK